MPSEKKTGSARKSITYSYIHVEVATLLYFILFYVTMVHVGNQNSTIYHKPTKVVLLHQRFLYSHGCLPNMTNCSDFVTSAPSNSCKCRESCGSMKLILAAAARLEKKMSKNRFTASLQNCVLFFFMFFCRNSPFFGCHFFCRLVNLKDARTQKMPKKRNVSTPFTSWSLPIVLCTTYLIVFLPELVACLNQLFAPRMTLTPQMHTEAIRKCINHPK